MAIAPATVPANDTNADFPQAMNQRQLERATVVLLFLGCLAYLWVFRRFTSLEPDEGIILQGATRILDGQIPYRDFFSFYTPGSFYLVAALFRFFGNAFVVARSSLALAGAVCSVITYLLCRRVCSRGVSVLVAALATVTGAAFRFLVLHNCYSTLFACLTLYASLRFLQTLSARWAFATGSLTAITFLFEQSKGGGLAIGLLLGFLLLRKRLFKNLVHLIGLGVGLAWPFLLTFGYFAGHGTAIAMAQGWLWPLHHYTAANHVAYGWQNWSDHTRDVIFRTGPLVARIAKIIAVSPGFVVPALPLFAIGALVYWAKRMRRSDADDMHAGYYIMTSSALTGLLLSVVVVRADILHFLYLAPLWYIALGWALGTPTDNRVLDRVRPALIAYVAIAFGMLGFAVLLATTGAHYKMETPRGEITTAEPDTVIPYLLEHTNPGDELLVYPYLPIYNYLTATRSPSRYDFFQPGMNTQEQAQEIILSLESNPSTAVLIEPAFAEKFANSWPETPLSAVVNDPVTDYVVHNFRTCKMLHSPEEWRFEYVVRKDAPCPEQN